MWGCCGPHRAPTAAVGHPGPVRERPAIEADEPPVRRAPDTRRHDEPVRAVGGSASAVVPVRRAPRRFVRPSPGNSTAGSTGAFARMAPEPERRVLLRFRAAHATRCHSAGRSTFLRERSVMWGFVCGPHRAPPVPPANVRDGTPPAPWVAGLGGTGARRGCRGSAGRSTRATTTGPATDRADPGRRRGGEHRRSAPGTTPSPAPVAPRTISTVDEGRDSYPFLPGFEEAGGRLTYRHGRRAFRDPSAERTDGVLHDEVRAALGAVRGRA